MVPHPAVIFLILIGIVIVLSPLLSLFGTCGDARGRSIPTRTRSSSRRPYRGSLLTVDGIRFMFTGVVPNFMSFNAVGVIIVAMVGVGVAEEVRAWSRR